MQPTQIYSELGPNNIPRKVILGQTFYGEDVWLDVDELFSHIYLRGTTGVGKSRMLSLVLQNLQARGRRVIMIDPLGQTYDLMKSWFGALAKEYYIQGNSFPWFEKEVLPNTLFVDLSNKEHPFRHNALKPMKGEDISDVISRHVKLFDLLYSGMDTELLRRANYVGLIAVFCATDTPLCKAKEFIYDRTFRERILSEAEKKKPIRQVLQAVMRFRYLDNEFKNKVAEKLNSLETALGPFFENPSVYNFLMTAENNIDFSQILNQKSCFIKAPVCDLATRKSLMAYLYTMFFDLSDKRSLNSSPVYLASDESSLVFSEMYADYSTRIRNHNVYLISSHQALIQMLDDEGMRMASTIEAMSKVRIYFKQPYSEAVQCVNENFICEGKTPKFIEQTLGISKSLSESTSEGISESHTETEGKSHGISTTEGASETASKTFSITDTQGLGESIQKQWSLAETCGLSNSINVNNSFTFSESVTEGMQQIQSDGLTFTIGENKSTMRISTDSGCVTFSESKGTSETTSENSGSSEGYGDSQTFSLGGGESDVTNYTTSRNGQSIHIVEGVPVALGQPATGKASSTLGKYKNYSNSNSQNRNRSTSMMKGIAHSLSQMTGKADSKGWSLGETYGITQQEAVALSRQFGEAKSLAEQWARGLQKSLGHSRTLSSSRGFSRSLSSATSTQISRALAQGESHALQTMNSFSQNINRSISQAKSYGKQYSFSTTTGMSIDLSWKLAFHSIPEEKELAANTIKTLPQGVFYLCVDGQEPIKTKAEKCFYRKTAYGEHDFCELLENYHKKLLSAKGKISLVPDIMGEIKEEIKVYPAYGNFSHVFPPRKSLNKRGKEQK